MSTRGWEGYKGLPEHRVQAATAKVRKYRNEPTEHDGITFASKREADRYVDLRAQQARGEISGLEIQPQLTLTTSDPRGITRVVGRYIADFKYRRNGADVWEDAKGVRTELFKWKKKHAEIEYGIEIVEV